jgi:iron(III) transport system ATP-binding protein
VLLDEPFASLDAHLRASVRADVQNVLAETGTTGVLVTHDQDEALSTADRVAVLRHGRIAQCAAPQDLYDRPADADIARFIGDANLIEGVLDAGMVDTVLGRLRLEPSCLASFGSGRGSLADGPAALAGNRAGPATVLVRPEQVELLAGPAAPSPAGRNRGAGPAQLAGRVVAYGYHGHDAVIHVRPEHGGDVPTIIVRTLGGPQLPAGSPVTLRARGPVLAWPRS